MAYENRVHPTAATRERGVYTPNGEQVVITLRDAELLSKEVLSDMLDLDVKMFTSVDESPGRKVAGAWLVVVEEDGYVGSQRWA